MHHGWTSSTLQIHEILQIRYMHYICDFYYLFLQFHYKYIIVYVFNFTLKNLLHFSSPIDIRTGIKYKNIKFMFHKLSQKQTVYQKWTQKKNKYYEKLDIYQYELKFKYFSAKTIFNLIKTLAKSKNMKNLNNFLILFW